MLERLKICWLVLTKKHYATFFYDRNEIGNTGAACYIDKYTETNKPLHEAIIETINDLNK